MRAIEDFEELLLPIDDVLHYKLLPSSFGGDCATISNHQDLLALNPFEGGLGINIVAEEFIRQYTASKKVTGNHVNSIIQETFEMERNSNGKSYSSEIKSEMKYRIRKEKM